MEKDKIGKLGESFCAEYYRKTGYEVLEMNYHSKYGEVDVIVKNEEYLIFVEVKTRKDEKRKTPSMAVTPSKQKKLSLTAMDYISKNNFNLSYAFDVFEVWHNEGRIYKFNRIPFAFPFMDFSGRYDVF